MYFPFCLLNMILLVLQKYIIVGHAVPIFLIVLFVGCFFSFFFSFLGCLTFFFYLNSDFIALVLTQICAPRAETMDDLYFQLVGRTHLVLKCQESVGS